MKSDYPHFYGHRQRMKEKILSSKSMDHFHDYEILESILFWSIPRRDVKPLAKDLLDKFDNLAGVMYASQERLLSLAHTSNTMYANFLILRELFTRVAGTGVLNRNVISSWDALVAYLKISMGNLAIEQFRILFLNKKNILIADEVQTSGTIDQTALYPREVIKRALFYEASGMIMAHNHPSGNPEPSKADIELTKQIKQACLSTNIVLHDHVIIAKNKFYSFKSNLLI